MEANQPDGGEVDRDALEVQARTQVEAENLARLEQQRRAEAEALAAIAASGAPQPPVVRHQTVVLLVLLCLVVLGAVVGVLSLGQLW